MYHFSSLTCCIVYVAYTMTKHVPTIIRKSNSEVPNWVDKISKNKQALAWGEGT